MRACELVEGEGKTLVIEDGVNETLFDIADGVLAVQAATDGPE